jgi:type I restriction enzyme S subunit
MKKDWPTRPLSEFVTSRPGNNKIIKGKQSDQPGDGLVQAFSASGPDVWVTTADYNQPGVVISAVGARCGKTFMADGEWTAIANTHVLLPGKDIDPRWLWYRTNEETFWIRGGAAQPFVKVKDTLQQPCKIPPLPEQQRIVGIIDEAFAGIATAKAYAEKNLQNARALFESYLHSVFNRPRKGWGEKLLGDVCECVNGKAHEQCIDEKGRFIVINSKFISTDGEVYKKSDKALLLLRPGDIAMVLSDVPNGNALAKCYLVEEADTYTLNQRICVIRSALFHTKFLFYQLNRNRYFLSFDNGENQTNLRLNQVLSCPLFLPPISEQQSIAAKLDAISEETQRLESVYQQKFDALEALKKSLLHQAFTDNL